jgi:hypothetical protein
VGLIPVGPIVARSKRISDGQATRTRELKLTLDDFTWEAVSEEAGRLGVTSEELARFSLLYYLADVDSGRIARRRPDLLTLS